MPNLGLESPFFSFYLRLPEGRWDLIERGGLRLEETRLGVSLRSAQGGLRWDGALEGAEVIHQGRETGLHGPVEALRLRMVSEGLVFSLEFALCLEAPLFLWRVGLLNEAAAALWLDSVDLLQVGPHGQGEPPARRRGAARPPLGVLRLHPDPGDLAFFSNGFQSWSFAGALGPRDRMPRTQLGPILWPENPDTAVPRSRGDFVAHMFGVLSDRAHRRGLLAGFLSQRQAFGSLRCRLARYSPSLRLWAHGDQVEIRPGAAITTDWACLQAVDLDAPDPIAPYLRAVASENDVRLRRAVPVGWCSWYKYMRGVSQSAVESNLGWAADQQAEIPLEIVQVDDGYQAHDAEMLETNDRFPAGLPALAHSIRARGLTPGLWLAPFITGPGSALARRHAAWLLRTRLGLPANAGSTWAPLSRGLDVTHPEVIAYTQELIRRAVHEAGFRYLKLDFLYAGVLVGRRHDPTVTRAQALEAILRRIREVAGDEVTLLGCGCPMGSGLGVFDAMRIGTDVSADWHPTYFGTQVLFKPEPTFPSVRNVLRNVLARSGMHRRWWINDPDCLLLRQEDTRLTPAEVQALATILALSGGSLLVSDDMPALDEERREWLSRLLPPLEGRLQVLEALESGRPPSMVLPQAAPAGQWWLCAALNWDEAPRAMSLDLRRFGIPEADGYRWCDPWGQQAGVSRSVVLDLGRVPAHGIALRAVRLATLEAAWLGDTLHLSQGAVVTSWEPGARRLTAGVGLVGRHRQGTAWLWLPAEPRRVALDGAPVTWRAIGAGIVALDLRLAGSSCLEVEW
ncbi:MAG: alpha-galactosidase [Chloroflexi bacterium]|nr:alpha-galactosidase [Chloroflexota bacterium]